MGNNKKEKLKMKVFASAVLLAAYVSAKELPETGDVPQIDVEIDANDLTDEQAMEEYWDKVKKSNYYWRNWWLGTFQGLYGMGGQVDRPTEDCFGDWIPEKRENLYGVMNTANNNFWTLTMEDAQNASYDVVDLLFLNDKYCHFRSAFWDVHKYCKRPEEAAEDWVSPCSLN